jgi:hypothetical protein
MFIDGHQAESTPISAFLRFVRDRNQGDGGFSGADLWSSGNRPGCGRKLLGRFPHPSIALLQIGNQFLLQVAAR